MKLAHGSTRMGVVYTDSSNKSKDIEHTGVYPKASGLAAWSEN